MKLRKMTPESFFNGSEIFRKERFPNFFVICGRLLEYGYLITHPLRNFVIVVEVPMYHFVTIKIHRKICASLEY